jgi:hypothetical protein
MVPSPLVEEGQDEGKQQFYPLTIWHPHPNPLPSRKRGLEEREREGTVSRTACLSETYFRFACPYFSILASTSSVLPP